MRTTSPHGPSVLIIASAAAAGERRIVCIAVAPDPRNQGERAQAALTSGKRAAASLPCGSVRLDDRRSTCRREAERHNIPAAGFRIERLRECRRCDAHGCDRSNKGNSMNIDHGLSLGSEAVKGTTPSCFCPRDQSTGQSIPSRVCEKPLGVPPISEPTMLLEVPYIISESRHDIDPRRGRPSGCLSRFFKKRGRSRERNAYNLNLLRSF